MEHVRIPLDWSVQEYLKRKLVASRVEIYIVHYPFENTCIKKCAEKIEKSALLHSSKMHHGSCSEKRRLNTKSSAFSSNAQ